MHFLLLATALLLSACVLPPRYEDGKSGNAATSDRQELIDSEPETIIIEGNTNTQSGAVIPERLLPGGILEIGDRDAPVSLLLLMNHASGYSHSLQQDLLPHLITSFVRSGSLRISIVPVPFVKYRNSDAEARALLCAAMQGKGLAMHDALLEGMPTGETIARLGIEPEAYTACTNDAVTDELIAAQYSLIRSLNVEFVPTYFINGEKFQGLPAWADLQGQVEIAQ